MDKHFHDIAVEVDGHKYICDGKIDDEHLVELDTVKMVAGWGDAPVDVTDVLDQGVYDEVTDAVTEALAEGVA